MRHRPQPRTIARPVRLTGLRVVTTATLAGSPARGPTVTGCCTPGGLRSDVHAKHLGKATSRSLVQAYRFHRHGAGGCFQARGGGRGHP
jgi:hypothetical protein